MSAQQPLVLAAGGTGGHLFPAQALAQAWRDRGGRVVLITDTRGMRFIKDFPADHIEKVDAATLSGGNPLRKISAAFKILSGVWQARRFLKRQNALAVVGFGGYPAFPAVAAAASLSMPTAVHEQNAILGRTNRALSRMVRAIACSFPDTLRVSASTRDKVVLTGNPVRSQIAEAATAYAPADLPEGIRILVFGGSQGAAIFSEIVPRALGLLAEGLRSRLSVIQQAREEDVNQVRDAYASAGIAATVAPFMPNMGELYAASHLIIARSGASTITELVVAGRPSILVPLPTAMDDQQTLNALALHDRGAAWVVRQADLGAKSLALQLEELLLSPAKLQEAAAQAREMGGMDAPAALVNLVEQIASGARPKTPARAGSTQIGRVF